jgi:hypothetical protein
MSVSSLLSVIAPQFDSDPARGDFISLAGKRVNYCNFGSNAETAHAYMTAHMMTMRDLSSKAGGLALGAVTSLKEGDLTISMKASSNGYDSELGATVYGKTFLGLQNGSIAAIGLTGVDGFCHPNLESKDKI